MLVLTRGTNESIMVGDQIEITIVEVRGDRVRIGIRAPASVAVHRKEVYLAIQEQNREAAKAAAAQPALLGELLARARPKGKEA